MRAAARTAQVAPVRAAAEAVTTLLQPAVSLAVLLAVALATAALRRQWLRGAVLAGTAVAGLGLLVLAVKQVVARSAPDGDGAVTTGWYPSGHTSALVVCAGTAVLLLWPPGGPGRRRGLAATAAAGAVMAASLVYSSYHWLTDVLAAGAASWLVLAVVALVDRAVRGAQSPSGASARSACVDGTV